MLAAFPESWQKKWEKEKFTSPSEIQTQSFKPLKEGQSAMLISPTGSGKTLAYLFPLLLNIKQGEGTQLCIVLPSQELAMQVVKVARQWAELLGLKVNAMIGGGNIRRQIDQLKKHPEVIVGTPGRLVELMDRKKIRAVAIKAVVLDEVDDLLNGRAEANFTSQLLKKINRDTQIVAVSATADLLEEEAKQWLPSQYQLIDVRQTDHSQGTITHAYIETPLRRRTELLRKLAYVENFRALVFFNQLQDLGVVADKLMYEGIPVSTLASDQSKFERQMALSQFNEGKVKLLLTTDLAARGLDFEQLDYIVQYDVPQMPDQYIHRVGRIGRMGRDGVSIALVNDRERRNLKQVAGEVTLTPLYLYDSVLYDEPVVTEKEEVSTKKQQKAVKKQEAAKKKHKKNKKKKQKNKGARRKGADCA